MKRWLLRPSGIACCGLGVASIALGACALLPGGDRVAPVCQSPHHDAIHPPTQKQSGFPHFHADTSHKLATLPFQVCDSAAEDLNQDGSVEILAADHIDSAFGYFVNDPAWLGSRIFDPGVRVPFKDGDDNSAGIVAADFNNDQKIDVASSNHPGTLTVRVNQTEKNSTKLHFPKSGETRVKLGIAHGPAYGLAGREGGLVAADFNLDGHLDIATSDLGKTNDRHKGQSDHCPSGDPELGRYSASVLLNTTEDRAEKVSFAPIARFPVPGPAISIASGDFNLDKKPDLVTANTGSSSLSVLTNETEKGAAEACFSKALTLPIKVDLKPQGAGPTNPLAIDLNGDGNDDIASANWNVRTVTVWINLTRDSEKGQQPRFSDPVTISTGKLLPLVLRGGDLNKDGLNDIVVIPLSTHSNAAMMVLRNDTPRCDADASPCDAKASFAVDAIYPIPRQLENRWLYAYFSSAGVVHDFDGDDQLDIGVIVARGSLLLKLMTPGNSILEFVDPGVPLWTVHPVLPHDSMLIIYKQEEAPGEVPVCKEPVMLGHSDYCKQARGMLTAIEAEVLDLHREHDEVGLEDHEIRSKQANHSAGRLQELAAASPPELRADVETIANHIELAGHRTLSEPSWHVDHDVQHATQRVSEYLQDNCGD